MRPPSGLFKGLISSFNSATSCLRFSKSVDMWTLDADGIATSIILLAS